MKKNLLILFASAAMLTACGGGGGDDGVAAAPAPAPAPSPAQSTTVPDSAGATVQSFVDYVAALIATANDTASPLSISAGFDAAVSETDSPRALP